MTIFLVICTYYNLLVDYLALKVYLNCTVFGQKLSKSTQIFYDHIFQKNCKSTLANYTPICITECVDYEEYRF